MPLYLFLGGALVVEATYIGGPNEVFSERDTYLAEVFTFVNRVWVHIKGTEVMSIRDYDSLEDLKKEWLLK